MPIIVEEAALQIVDSGIPVDRWPCFTLKDVSVLSESTRELVSLFSGHKYHPVSVVGYLQEIPETHAHLVLDSSCTRGSSRLVVKNVTSWTCARSPSDGLMEFYAVGKAGKYRIRTPATLYGTFFDQMRETASMFNFIEAKFRNMRKNASDLSDSYVNNYGRFTFNEYLNSASNCLGRQNVEDVKAGFHDNAEHLITMMLAGARGSDGLDWESSPMMRYFKQKCPGENAKVRSRMNPTGPMVLSFRPNFQRQEPIPVRKRATKPVPEEDDTDTAGPNIPPRESGTEGPGTVRRSTRTAAPRAKTSLFSMQGLSDDFEPLDDAVEPNDPSPLSERKLRGPGGLTAKPRIKNEQKRPLHRTWDEIRQQKLAADPEPYSYPPSNYVRKTLVKFEFPNEEPQGPGGLWTCEFRGCGFREHAADTAEGLERLRKHLHENHEGAEEVVPNPRGFQGPSAFGNHPRRVAPELLEEIEQGFYQPSLRANIAHQTNHPSSRSSAGNVARSSGLLLDANGNVITNIPAQPRPVTEPQVELQVESQVEPQVAATRASSSRHKAIDKNIATDPSSYLSSASNLSATTTTTSRVLRSASGSASSSFRRQNTRDLGGNTIQSPFSSLTLSSNTRSFASSEAVPPDDDGSNGSSTALPTPTTTQASRRRGVMRRY